MAANDKQVGGSHYAAGLQHWDLIEKYGIGYLEGCATKYVTRWRKKNGKQDLEKALHYVDKLIELKLEGVREDSRGYVPQDVFQEFVTTNGLYQIEAAIIAVLCNWRTVYDLREARLFIQQLIQEP